MTIYYSDHLGAVAVEVNEYGISFDRENGNALFMDENGREYIIPVSSIIEIAPHALIPLF